MSSPQPLTASELWAGFTAWVRREPVQAVLGAVLLAVLVYFFGFYKVFMNGVESTAVWAAQAWNSENDLEYGGFILPGAIVMAWYHRDRIAAAPKSISWAGLAIVFGATVLYVLAARTLQPRLALIAFPALIYGGVRFLWGPAVARVILFPCAFLLFMVPVGFLVSHTVGLQNMAASVAASLSKLLGIEVVASGASLYCAKPFFNFEVAGGCSGIRSLTAMTMLAAVYVHFTQRELWKKLVIFAGSLFFALIGNFVRIFSVVLFARFISPTVAAGLYHDYSGFVFFPIAVFSMLGVSNLLNRDWSTWLQPDVEITRPTASRGAAAEETPAPVKRSSVSYDY